MPKTPYLSGFLHLWGASMTSLTGPNTGLVFVKGNTVATSGRLWAFAGYSRFIRPGAVRIGTTTSAASLEVSAFRNSDGSMAVVVLNSAHSPQVATFSLRGLTPADVTPYLTDTSHEALSGTTSTERKLRKSEPRAAERSGGPAQQGRATRRRGCGRPVHPLPAGGTRSARW